MYAAAFLALASTVIGAPAPRAVVTPSTYATGYLENYAAYHLRYLALECYDQHNTTFFEDCCHPLLATQSLADRPAECTPNATEISSAAEYLSTYTVDISATATASADAQAQSEYSEAAAQTSTAQSTAAAQTTAAPASAQAQAAQPTSATPSSTTQAAAQSSQASNNNGGNTPSGNVMTGGFATFFYQGGQAGECGTVHSDWDKIVAIDAAGWWPDYASNDNSPYCGRWVNIQNTQNGKTVTAQVADVCPTCVSDNSLDLSLGAFTAIAEEWEGSVPIVWSWA